MWFRMYHMQQAAVLHTLRGNFAKFILLKSHHLGVMKLPYRLCHTFTVTAFLAVTQICKMCHLILEQQYKV